MNRGVCSTNIYLHNIYIIYSFYIGLCPVICVETFTWAKANITFAADEPRLPSPVGPYLALLAASILAVGRLDQVMTFW